MKSIGIVGSGLVGITLAIGLKERGYDVVVYDKSKDIREIDFSGRSINLALSHRGWKTMQQVGIDKEIEHLAIPMYQREIHKLNQDSEYQPYGLNGESIWAISRGELNKELVSIAEKKGVLFRFETAIYDIDLENATLYIGESEAAAWETIKHDFIFGADGAYSKVRNRMQRQSRFEYQQSYLSLGYKELVMPGNSNDGKHVLDPNSFHIWPRKDFMLIALANIDGSFTCTLFMPFEGEISFESIKTEQEIKAFFERYFPDALSLVPNLVSMYQMNPVNSLVTMKCFPWVHKDKVALIGDAAHAIVPFYGQGLNAGLEDVSVLLHLLDNGGDLSEEVLMQYQSDRKENADAIAELSYRNFEEMSTHTGDRMFLLRKKIEVFFAKKYPNMWLPLYDRVTFSANSYSEALKYGDVQRQIMDRIMKKDSIEVLWDNAKEEVEAAIIAEIDKVRGL
ncbi:MAG: FAD-dependent monooxygenase [Flavobacteriaceae bacterium]|jgi:kynurenine 3-monooxygenase|nr:FAD-dependent monooxygenase [Flavobacteriaceae bacterium]